MRVTGAVAGLVLTCALLSSCTPDLVAGDGVALPASDTPVPPGLADRCPPRKTPGRFPAGGHFPDGAVAVRLCNPDVLDGYDADVRADVPLDVLDTRVEEFVDALNDLAQPENTGTQGELKHFCPADGGPLVTWWVIYPGGEAWSAEYFTAGCKEVQVDTGIPRPGGPETMALFTDLLLDQRRERTPPPVDEAAPCDYQSPVSPLTTPERIGLLSAARCEQDGALTLSFDLGGQRLASLDAAFRDGRRLPDRECRSHGRTFAAVTAWGDQLRLWTGCLPR